MKENLITSFLSYFWNKQ